MKDIDFDELDRAVSSVLSQKKPSDDAAAPASYGTDDKKETVAVTNNTATPKDDDKVVAPADQNQADQNDTKEATPESPSSASTEPETQAETVTPSATSTSPLAVKRRGKFMDVMHPSHDMAPNSPTPAALPVSKPKHLLSPVSQDMKSDDSDSHTADTKPEPVSTHTEPVVEKPEPVVEPSVDNDDKVEKKPTSLYIDPLELDGKSKDVKPDEEPVEAKDPSSDEVAAPEAPQTTPFLSDAKVEKRPLGGFNEPETTSEPSSEADTSAEQPANNQVAPSVPLPRELQPDVVEVEAVHDDTRPPVSDTANAQSAEPDTAADSKPTSENNAAQSHPLFDTSTYHEPTAAKRGGKKPGWLMWLVGFVVCLAIGGGVGYFLFTAGF